MALIELDFTRYTDEWRGMGCTGPRLDVRCDPAEILHPRRGAGVTPGGEFLRDRVLASRGAG